MRPVRIIGPSGPVVSLAELKAQLRVEHDEENDLIAAYEAAAVAWLDGYGGILGRCILPQTWEEPLMGWGAWPLTLPDVRSIEQVAYVDHLGAPAFLAPGVAVVGGGAVPVLTAWGPGGASAIHVRYLCGMPEADLPAIRQAIRMIVAHWHSRRETVSEGAPVEVPLAARALIDSKRFIPL